MILHGAVVLLLIRATQQLRPPIASVAEPLIFLLPHKDETVQAPAASSAPASVATPAKHKRSAAPIAQSDAITLPTEAASPKIDWDHEAELAARSQLTDAGKERDYRNLGGLSDAQLKWVRDNHMVPMAPGIVWAHPRVEVDKATLLPIIHINDHCVLVLVFVFCGVGHIQPDSHLLDHMHDQPK
jgi:hypothetical protein